VTPEGRARVVAAVIASNKRRGEQDPARRQARSCYTQQKANATGRGIEFRLTFDEWMAVWAQSGRWSERGKRRGQFVMCRVGDTGVYEVGNVFIGPTQENVGVAHRGKPKSPEQRAKMSETAKRRPRKADGTYE
jgi:hypothetical protein